MVEGRQVFDLLWLVPAIPLFGAIFNCLLGARAGNLIVSIVGCGSIGLAFALSVCIFRAFLDLPPEDRMIEFCVFQWIAAGNFLAPIDLLLDPLSMAMITMVSGVSFLIHVYSVGYMEKDKCFARYFFYLNLFVFFMLTLVLAGNFLVLYIGWEGVGLCSYLLISFWYEKRTAAAAGLKAFVVTRFGDFFFALGIMLVFVQFGTIHFHSVFEDPAKVIDSRMAMWIALLIFAGAVGKSAQIPLHTWLPDAMEAPTPVSALIHAATMVTAGVYLVARCYPIFELSPVSLQIVGITGLLTAFISATVALVHTDIKRILAYSTVSQLGHMFLALGVGAPAAAVFHLLTHAFAKALLFLGSGAVIHALHDEMDIRNMGGLRQYIPATFYTFTIGALAMSGIPGLAGFFSKDAILHATFVNGGFLMWALIVITASMTGFYTFRIIFVAFFGEKRWDVHIHHPGTVMVIPLVLLALLAAVGGYMGVPHVLGGGDRISNFLAPNFGNPEVHATAEPSNKGVALAAEDETAVVESEEAAESEKVLEGVTAETLAEGEGHAPAGSPEMLLMLVSAVMAFSGVGLAYFFYVTPEGREVPAMLSDKFGAVYNILTNAWYFDKVYKAVFIDTYMLMSEFFWKAVDTAVIDHAVRGVAGSLLGGGSIISSLQLGLVRWYATVMVLGAIIIILYI
ncbi:MAG: NADH-quinone oxidoreductase subunit L [Planctomycetes bacterium RIFCSPHIGHO2_02_FULL_50_42]|nr:MAG: NADH-quinone oxidoreductase subunit L [Planctomycetes bacterium RIFCSPHIGHO2_02_FULL_50_42]